MDATDLTTFSPYGQFLDHCSRGKLSYQRMPDGTAVFYPRAVAPGDGRGLSWEISSGDGSVYALTIVRPRDEAPFLLALVDLDEGFRMMSRVDTDAPEHIRIGDRVRVGFRSLADGQPALPVFTSVEVQQ